MENIAPEREGLSGGYAPEPRATEGGTFEDYAVTSNVYGMSFYHPETNTNAETYADRWNTQDKMELFKTLKTKEERDVLNSSVSLEHYNVMTARRGIAQKAEERIANDNPVVSFAAGSAMSLLDPTTLVPGTLAFKGSKGLLALKRVAYGAATGATLGVTQEAQLAETNSREAHLGSAAFWGATIGGGMFAIGPMISGTKAVASSTIAKAYTEPSLVEKALSGQLGDVEYKPGDDFITVTNEHGVKQEINVGGVGLEPVDLWEPGQAPAMNKYIQKFVISPVSRLARAKYPLFNRIGTMLQSSPIYRTMGGKIFAEPKNAWDIKQDLTAAKGKALAHIEDSFIGAQERGYTGNVDEYMIAVNDAIDNVIERVQTEVYDQVHLEMQQQKVEVERRLVEIDSQYRREYNERLKQHLKQHTNLERRQSDLQDIQRVYEAEAARAKEEFLASIDNTHIKAGNSNYQKRVNELLVEKNNELDIDSLVPEHLRGGVKSYQMYIENYAKRMQKVKMRGSEYLTPKVYKTRAWNFEAFRGKSRAELFSIIYKAFVEHPMNKKLLQDGHMREATATKRVNQIIDHMNDITLVRDLPDNTLTVPSEMPLGQFLQHKNFQLNDKYLGELIEKDMRHSMEQYNYNMSGRVALHTMFGTDNLKVLQREVVLPAVKQAEEMGASRRELESLSDDFDTLFNQVLGTHGLPEKPNAWGERATRSLMKLNYLTFGGGFGINALADVGVVAFTNGLTNTLRHFSTSLKAIRDLRGTSKEFPWVEQALAMGALSDFYAARALSRYDDMDTMFTSDRIERLLDKGGQVMQNASGLQHVTAIEELMAIGGGTVDIVNTARKYALTGKLPRGFEERIGRYGLTIDDLKWVAEQPVLIKNGHLIDFNWSKWNNKQRMTRFQTAITKMMNDAVIRGDKTLLPHYMTSKNPFMRLMTQFMRYPHIAYERVLLRGASKPTARFLTGTMTSATLMASIYYIREQALIEAGVIDEKDAKYAIYDKFGNLDEEAVARLSYTVLMKLPQFGHIPDIGAKAAALTGQEFPGRAYKENPWTAIGGVSATRFDSLSRLLSKGFNGELDGMDAYYFGKSITPFQNFLQIDQVYNPMIKDMLK